MVHITEQSNNNIYVNGTKYEVMDALNNITLADSFVKNKIGTGHGEAKLYVGNYNERYTTFFDNLNRDFFFMKKDFDKYLLDAKDEFLNPQQDYNKKEEMPDRYNELLGIINDYNGGMMKFTMYRKDVNPPRVYLQSDSEYYSLMRELGIPNISYLSILKLKNLNTNKISYYCRIFIDYKPDIIKYESPMEKEQEEEILSSNLSEKRKHNLLDARQGQGEYRRKLLEECQSCPFTLVNDERLLIASHIKPWVKSNDKEKIDPKNGFALTPTYDKLFDQGFITFESDKKLKVSPWISPMNQNRLNIFDGKNMPTLQLDDKREKYLKYHRAEIFKG